MHDMLVAAGGADVFADVKRQSLQVSTEMLLARKPEVIIEVHAVDELAGRTGSRASARSGARCRRCRRYARVASI